MRSKRTRIQAKKRARTLASALAEINARHARVFKRLSRHDATEANPVKVK